MWILFTGASNLMVLTSNEGVGFLVNRNKITMIFMFVVYNRF